MPRQIEDKMKQKWLLICGLLWFVSSFSQPVESTHKIMFYNVENLFHPSDDSLTLDDDFTPTGSYHWTYKKYYRKVAMIGKVIMAAGMGDPPWLVGLAEVENEKVLKDLCYNSPLRKFGYRYVHYDSPDRRGVDVAMLYRDVRPKPRYPVRSRTISIWWLSQRAGQPLDLALWRVCRHGAQAQLLCKDGALSCGLPDGRESSS